MHRHNMAEHANTQNYEKGGGTCTAIIWQETQIHKTMRNVEVHAPT